MVNILCNNKVYTYDMIDFCSYFQNDKNVDELIDVMENSTQVYIGSVYFDLSRMHAVASLYSIVYGLNINDKEQCNHASNMTYLTRNKFMDPDLYIEALEHCYRNDINDLGMISDLLYEISVPDVPDALYQRVCKKFDYILSAKGTYDETLQYIMNYGDKHIRELAANEIKTRQRNKLYPPDAKRLLENTLYRTNNNIVLEYTYDR